jgi:hypothetical protein
VGAGAQGQRNKKRSANHAEDALAIETISPIIENADSKKHHTTAQIFDPNISGIGARMSIFNKMPKTRKITIE